MYRKIWGPLYASETLFLLTVEEEQLGCSKEFRRVGIVYRTSRDRPKSAPYLNKPRTAKVGAISKAQNCESGLCETPAGCKIWKKMKGDPLVTLKNFPKNFWKKWFLNSVTVPKNVERGTLWDFLTSIVLQNIERNEEDPLVQSKKFQKKSHGAEKKWG